MAFLKNKENLFRDVSKTKTKDPVHSLKGRPTRLNTKDPVV